MTQNIQPVAIYTADDSRQAWYTSVLNYFGIPVIDWQTMEFSGDDAPRAEQVVIDFGGVSPDQRQMLSQVVASRALAPVVVGDTRHTPHEEDWQRVPHMPVFFTLDDVLKSLSSATHVTG